MCIGNRGLPILRSYVVRTLVYLCLDMYEGTTQKSYTLAVGGQEFCMLLISCPCCAHE